MSAPLLEYRDLGIAFGDVQAVSGLSLEVAEGQRVGIIGESGSGKTTAGLAGVGIVQRGGRVSSGGILIGGRTVLEEGAGPRAQLSDPRLAMVFQDAKLSFDPLRTVGSHVAEVLAVRGVPRPRWRARAEELLAEVGLPDPARAVRAYPHELSGGMRQRAMIAVALAAEPRLLIADEPTSALDVTTQAAVIDLLVRLSDEHAMAVLLVSHDIDLVRSFASEVHVMHRGVAVEGGPVERVLSAPEHAYTASLLAASPPVPVISPAVAALVLSGADTDDETAGAAPATVAPAIHAPAENPLVAIGGLVKEFRSGPPFGRLRRVNRAVDDVTLGLLPGETLGIVGQSGSGKTTLARMLAGLERPTAGEVRWADALRPAAGELQMVFQDPSDTLDPLIRVGDAVAEPLCIRRGGRASRYRTEVAELLQEVGLGPEHHDRLPGELSGGQRQRVAIARALSTHPRVIVADEPVSALDASLRSQILKLIRRVQVEHGISIIQITHDLLSARESCDRIAVMYHGRIVELSTAEDLFAEPRHPYTRRLIAAIPAVRAAVRAEAGA